MDDGASVRPRLQDPFDEVVKHQPELVNRLRCLRYAVVWPPGEVYLRYELMVYFVVLLVQNFHLSAD